MRPRFKTHCDRQLAEPRARRIGLALILFSGGSLLSGQTWTGGPSGPIYYTGGNVGIGTTSPRYPLTVVGAASVSSYIQTPHINGAANLVFDTGNNLGDITLGNNYMTIKSGGGVGVGTSAPLAKLHVVGTSEGSAASHFNTAGQDVFVMEGSWPNLVLFDKKSFGSNAQSYSMRTSDTTSSNYDDWVVSRRGYGDYFAIGRTLNNNNPTVATGVPFLVITPTGNVGIGTTNPQNTLSVNGIVQAKEVLVNTGWSDYVFAADYRLRPLVEVETFIKGHHHLPDIPSEAEVREKGVSLGEMQSKLLAKIEELTLHMIEAEKRTNLVELQNL